VGRAVREEVRRDLRHNGGPIDIEVEIKFASGGGSRLAQYLMAAPGRVPQCDSRQQLVALPVPWTRERKMSQS
jgi:hypothetical protein